ncbi:AraC family transcriptional regulator [Candidatus Fukatsuia symbiotica]|uniref:AraC family transcriptional regulator n=1 Tax=Candidatus Fukatsuia symbiotica TaxID=1878942 RepID=A0A2U8I4C3_9GAMM|nr:helix-turn-helix domain-containing protein [Candidatus Fukatsuia symbiotica]AWK13991.1 AraC family transcriptional regulator [Candidatus Fukatsuia symbiotica]MEA9445664.1 AraC family transcriptional regulator [Candidatus Fukatsuia symbiotica]
MKSIQFILFRQDGTLRCGSERSTIPAGHLVVADENAIASTFCRSTLTTVFCYPIDLLPLYQTLAEQSVQSKQRQRVVFETCKMLPLQADMMQAAEQLTHMERGVSLRFLYLYCLGMENAYFSSLLNLIVGTNNELLEFFEQNSLNPWSVSRYADELGISTRKLNFLFYQKFGMSVKQWLLDQRLKKGCELLLSTRLRVADIAMECGFSNHAHFSDSFRRRYQQCPSQLRTLTD